jgi:N-acetylglucosamine repressor
MRKATQQQTKEHNRNLVLSTVIAHECVSRAEIARITSLTRTTVSDIVADLIEGGLVREVGVGSSLGGKSPILLSLVNHSRFLIGLELARNKFSGAIIDLRGNICQRVDLPIDGDDGQAALASVYALLDRLVEMPFKPLIGIGIGTPGLVDASNGVVVNAVNLDWKNLPLGELVRKRYHLPVSVLNDSQAAAMGEYAFAAGHKEHQNLIVISVRHGIGAGIIVNGQLFHGDGGGAGEIGHVVVVREGGLPCRCGHLGCLETVAGTQAVVQRARTLARDAPRSALARLGDGLTFDALVQAYAAGDPVARQVAQEAGRYLGMAVSSLVGTLNIQRIVLAGDMTRFGRSLLDIIQETLSQTMLAGLVQGTQVGLGVLGSNGIILGASALVSSNYALLFQHKGVA